MQRCSKCKLMLPLEEFYRAESGRNGRRADCKECVRSSRRTRRGSRTSVRSDAERTAQVTPISSVLKAVDSGTRRDLLVALRARLFAASTSPETSNRDLPALSRELTRIAAELDALDALEQSEMKDDRSRRPRRQFDPVSI